MISKPVASIVILTYNNLEYTRLCLESLYAKTRVPEFETIIVDNASSDGTPGFLQEFTDTHPNARAILNSANEGFARGNNIGTAAATGEYLVFLNNGWAGD
jgi:GT2 family glycosyltransferase